MVRQLLSRARDGKVPDTETRTEANASRVRRRDVAPFPGRQAKSQGFQNDDKTLFTIFASTKKNVADYRMNTKSTLDRTIEHSAYMYIVYILSQ